MPVIRSIDIDKYRVYRVSIESTFDSIKSIDRVSANHHYVLRVLLSGDSGLSIEYVSIDSFESVDSGMNLKTKTDISK
jgi:hypothetical protein